MVEFRNILCPIDLSDASSRPLAYATAFTRWYEARLTVLHVVPTFDPMQVRSGALGDPVRILYPMTRDEILSELRRAVDAAGAGALDVALATDAGDAAATSNEFPSSNSLRTTRCSERSSMLRKCRRFLPFSSGGPAGGGHQSVVSTASLSAITDSHGRTMVLMTHNTDISDAWEREGEDPQFFYSFSPHGYALAINVLIYTMTH